MALMPKKSKEATKRMLSSSSSPESVLSEVRKTSSKQRRLSSSALQEPKMASSDEGHTTITIILDKLNSMQTRMDDGFNRAHSDMNEFRQEIKSQVKGLQDTVKDVEKSLDNGWEELKGLDRRSELIYILRNNTITLKLQDMFRQCEINDHLYQITLLIGALLMI